MSLTTELKAGPLADWFRRTFPITPSLAGHVAAAVSGATVCPPPARVRAGHHGSVGGAWGMRLGFAVEPAPPYYALYGAHNAGLIGYWPDRPPPGGSTCDHHARTLPPGPKPGAARTPSGQ